MKRSGLHPALYVLLLLMIGGNLYLIKLMIDNKAAAYEVIGWLTGAFLPLALLILDQLQKRRLTVFLLTQRFRALFSYHTPSWRVSAHFTGDDLGIATLDKITDRLTSRNPLAVNAKFRKITDQIVQVGFTPGPELEISLDTPSRPRSLSGSDKRSSSIHVSIKNYKVDYKNARHAILHEIVPILDEISRCIDDVDAKYSLVIHYDKNSNPFFGLYVAHLDPAVVATFSVQLLIGENEDVAITEKQLAINTRSQSSFQNLALEFLTFDRRLGEHLR